MKPAAEKPVVEAPEEPMTADGALAMLREGNGRWVADKEENPSIGPSRRYRLSEKGQKPFAAILTCADSRLPVERLFDRGVGELFVVRVAGNIAGTSETGTMEYGIEHLHIPLLVVMGHTKCGAVAAAASGADVHGALGELVSNITPAVDRAKRNNPDADATQIASLAVKENVWQSITDLLRHSPEVRVAASKGEVRIVGAVCDIATGKVEWMGEHPWQSELIEAFGNRARSTVPATAGVHEEK
jgi:carbonic anhydrase